ncbi:MAG: hypothetical protein ACYS7Y_33495 [Planctomycetota bacterium]|jgi:hypothetical protein
MNPDLHFRLLNFDDLSVFDRRFFYKLLEELTIEAMLPVPGIEDVTVDFMFEELDEDGFDTAYMESSDGLNFTIYLDKRIPVGMMFDYAIHELAHVHSWHHDEKNDHGPEWGKSYAALYSRYLDLYDLYWC